MIERLARKTHKGGDLCNRNEASIQVGHF